jgi:hypothetical protein
MNRLITLLLLLIVSLPPVAVADQAAPLLRFAPLQGQLDFVQLKTVQGLPVPLRSSGYLQISTDRLLWHTTTPVDTKLLISPAGVSQWQQQQYVAVAGSEFVGQLLLAVLQQQQEFILAHFQLATGQNNCLLLQPLQPPLNQLFSQIELCGQQTLQQLTLTELNGNHTDISLQPAVGTP